MDADRRTPWGGAPVTVTGRWREVPPHFGPPRLSRTTTTAILGAVIMSPLIAALVLVAVAAAEPGPMAWWQRIFATFALIAISSLTAELIESLHSWGESE